MKYHHAPNQDATASRLVCFLIAMLSFYLTGAAADVMAPLPLKDVHAGGEIGRRIAVTVENNLLKLDADRDFLPLFRAKAASIIKGVN